ncbi:MAG: hypothetical protein J5526_07070 [Bacteroidales bacterium]|nr:hypothetical protein [Bacteroidales bacterium]
MEKKQDNKSLTGCGIITLIMGIIFSISIFFVKGFPISSLVFSFIFSLCASYLIARVVSFCQRYYRDRKK